jgi:hypothetical protein
MQPVESQKRKFNFLGVFVTPTSTPTGSKTPSGRTIDMTGGSFDAVLMPKVNNFLVLVLSKKRCLSKTHIFDAVALAALHVLPHGLRNASCFCSEAKDWGALKIKQLTKKLTSNFCIYKPIV